MRFCVAALSALLAPSAALSLFNSDSQRAITSNDDLKIPGESPLEHCPDRKAEGYVEIKSVDLAPNPPSAYVLSPHALVRWWLAIRWRMTMLTGLFSSTLVARISS